MLKMRLARTGEGKRGGFRVLVAFKTAKRSVFVFGFAKKDRDNISDTEEETYRDLAGIVLGLSEKQIDKAIDAGEFFEVDDGDKEDEAGDGKAEVQK